MKNQLFSILAIVPLLLLTACEPKPQPVEIGSDNCSYCKMMISQEEFAAQVINPQGKNFNFDSIECMAAYVISAEQDKIHSAWVTDFSGSDEWLNAGEAVYLKSKTLRSPMGMNLSAYPNIESASEIQKEYGGDIIGYEQMLSLVKKEWLSGSTHNVNHNH